ncbi:unnamed protein product [Urochloa humidicola]
MPDAEHRQAGVAGFGAAAIRLTSSSSKASTKGVGQTAPDLSDSKTTEDRVVVPLGKPKQEPSKRGSLLYNEYILYNVD